MSCHYRLTMPIPKLSTYELPPGEHLASLDEIETTFGQSTHQRQKLMTGLRTAASNFEQAGVTKLWIDGSFVTRKLNPNDIDGCWEYTSKVNTKLLDPVFLRTRKEMKAKYGLDFLIAGIVETGSGLPFPKYFQINRNGDPKGIIVIQSGGHS